MTQKKVPLSKLVANPYRDIDQYEIHEEKIEALISSYEQTGYWGNILARESGGKVEIAYGHHRLEALRRHQKRGSVDVIIRKLTNEDMIRIMASENLEEWGSSIWVEMETVKSTLQAYADGEIKLPKVPAKLKKSEWREAPSVLRDVGTSEFSHPYVPSLVAGFLGWSYPSGKPKPQAAIAFQCLEAIEMGAMTEKQLRGLSRQDAEAVVGKAMKAYRTVKARTKKETGKADTKKAARAAKEVAQQLQKEHAGGAGLRSLRESTVADDVATRVAGPAREPELPRIGKKVDNLIDALSKILDQDKLGQTLDALHTGGFLDLEPGHWKRILSELKRLDARVDKWIKRSQKHGEAQKVARRGSPIAGRIGKVG